MILAVCYQRDFTSRFLLSLGSVYASSTLQSDSDKWGPHLAIDGKYSSTNEGLYISENETYPWHMRMFDQPMRLVGVKIYNRKDCCGNRLKSVEVRAGKQIIDANFNGKIKANTLCGTFDGPGVDRGVYTVTCLHPIEANIVTLQIVESGHQILELDEVEYIQGILHLRPTSKFVVLSSNYSFNES